MSITKEEARFKLISMFFNMGIHAHVCLECLPCEHHVHYHSHLNDFRCASELAGRYNAHSVVIQKHGVDRLGAERVRKIIECLVEIGIDAELFEKKIREYDKCHHGGFRFDEKEGRLHACITPTELIEKALELLP